MIASILSKSASRAADWGFSVSIGIAVICDDQKSIAIASDQKATFSDFSADNAAMKIVRLYQKYWVIIAGDDVEYAEDILREAYDALAKDEKTKSPKQVADAVNDAYWSSLHAQIESRVLRRHKFTVDSFRDTGSKKCTATVYNNLCAKIERVEIKLKFLVLGFSGNGKGHIYLVDGQESPKCFDSVGVWAIGSGEHAALSSLAFHIERKQLSKYGTSREDGIYFACEAKFMAETSGYVGKDTASVGVISSRDLNEREVTIVPTDKIAEIKEIWKTQGAPRIPENIEETIKGMLKIIQPSKPSDPQKSADQQ
jgi:20S proteasome alpha/beta subunit